MLHPTVHAYCTANCTPLANCSRPVLLWARTPYFNTYHDEELQYRVRIFPRQNLRSFAVHPPATAPPPEDAGANSQGLGLYRLSIYPYGAGADAWVNATVDPDPSGGTALDYKGNAFHTPRDRAEFLNLLHRLPRVLSAHSTYRIPVFLTAEVELFPLPGGGGGGADRWGVGRISLLTSVSADVMQLSNCQRYGAACDVPLHAADTDFWDTPGTVLVRDVCPSTCGALPSFMDLDSAATTPVPCNREDVEACRSLLPLGVDACDACQAVELCPEVRDILYRHCRVYKERYCNPSPSPATSEPLAFCDREWMDNWDPDASDDTSHWCVYQNSGLTLLQSRVPKDNPRPLCSVEGACPLGDDTTPRCTSYRENFWWRPVHRMVPTTALVVSLRGPAVASRVVSFFTDLAEEEGTAVGAIRAGMGEGVEVTLLVPGTAAIASAKSALRSRLRVGYLGRRLETVEAILNESRSSVALLASRLEGAIRAAMSGEEARRDFGGLSRILSTSVYSPAFIQIRGEGSVTLSASFGPSVGEIFFDTPLDPTGVTRIRPDLSPLFSSLQGEVGGDATFSSSSSSSPSTSTAFSWGIYERQVSGGVGSGAACPIPDDDVWNPRGLVHTQTKACRSGSLEHWCREGDLLLKAGSLVGRRPGDATAVWHDPMLALQGWRSIEGKTLTLASETRLLCAEIKRVGGRYGSRGTAAAPPSHRPSSSTALTANFSDAGEAQQSSGRHLTGFVTISQAAGPGTDTLIKVELNSSVPLEKVSYHISERALGDYGDCTAEYRDAQLYDPYGRGEVTEAELAAAVGPPVDGAGLSCIERHPMVPNVESRCPLGDITPQVWSHVMRDGGAAARELPLHGSAVHPFLDVAGAVPALRPTDGSQPAGRTLVVLSSGLPVACASLLTDAERVLSHIRRARDQAAGSGEKEQEGGVGESGGGSDADIELAILLATFCGCCCVLAMLGVWVCRVYAALKGM